MRMSLRHFRIFVAVAEAGQVSKAAAALSTSQPAITEAVKALEAEIGVKLFDRHPRGMRLTYAGSVFLQHARGVMAAAAQAMLAPQQAGYGMEGHLTIACTHTVIGYFLPPLLTRFRRIFPEIQVKLIELDRPQIVHSILNNDVDMAICLTALVENADAVETEVLARSKRRLWLPASHTYHDLPRVELTQVQSEPYIMLVIDDAEEVTQTYWQAAGLRPNVVFRTSSMEAIRNLVAAGHGVTILSDMVFRPWSLEGERLSATVLADDIPSMDIGLAWRRDTVLTRNAKAFRDICRSGLRGPSPIGEPDLTDV